VTRLREVAAGILVATSRRDALNTVVVLGDAPGALLVDPGWDPDELDDLADDLAERSITPVAGVATHAHHDHLLWHPGFGAVPRWASPATASLAASQRAHLLGALGPEYRAEVLDLMGEVTALRPNPPAPNTVPWAGPAATLIVHRAHIRGHTAVWIARGDILIAGDMLSDTELPLLGDTPRPLHDYREGLRLLAPYVARARLVIPGHGNPTSDALARLNDDRRYLLDLASGRASSDARLARTGMAAAHLGNLALAKRELHPPSSR
jgi:glyoxylase-like metal-dependent hydrolase (beta-lactamase superfamily II)